MKIVDAFFANPSALRTVLAIAITLLVAACSPGQNGGPAY
jgi:hypothetical protein